MSRKTALTYDDIQLVPSYSEIKSRKDINLNTLVSRRYGLLNPIVGSPMDTVCEYDMALKLAQLGGVGCIHRFMNPLEQAGIVSDLKDKIYDDSGEDPSIAEYWGVMYDSWHAEERLVPIMAAIGVSDADLSRASLLIEAGANIILIDVAHGHHANVIRMIKQLKQYIKLNAPHVDIIAGNIATKEAALDLAEAGADGLRVGIGGGCFTPHMKVNTDNGLKEIKDIEIGDNVYTHTGELKPVINKFVYDDHKELVIINDIETTPNHKFYVVHKDNADLVTDDNYHNYAEWVTAENLTADYFLIEL